MTAVRRTLATLKYGSKYAYITFIALAHTILTKMGADPVRFASAAALLALLTSQLKELDDAQEAVVRREPKASGVRSQKRDVVLATLEALKQAVQALADASPDKAAIIIEAAGMLVRGTGSYLKPIIAGYYGGVPGAVRVELNAASFGKKYRKNFYRWQHTLDGGKTFIDDGPSPDARMLFTGLPLHTEVGFRAMRTSTKESSDWTHVATFLVR